MIFPDGAKKEGYFENNVFKVKVQISVEQQEIERQNNVRPQQAQQLERGTGSNANLRKGPKKGSQANL